eukprot:5424547-Pyramimonas_sp.AAC.1
MTALPLAAAARGGDPGGLAAAMNGFGQALDDMEATVPAAPPPPGCKQMLSLVVFVVCVCVKMVLIAAIPFAQVAWCSPSCTPSRCSSTWSGGRGVCG